MFTVLHRTILFCFLFAAGSVAYAAGYDADVSRVDINFAQTFGAVACPATAPAGDFCLNVTGTSDSPVAGHVEFKRIVMVNAALFDNAHPTCIPDETTGTLTLPRGTLTFHAPGNVCFADGIASYDVVITGGTDAYAGALGGGKIIVPPPLTGSTGSELWHLELFRTARNDYRFW